MYNEAVPTDDIDPPDSDEVMFWNRLSGVSGGFTLPRQLDELQAWLDHHHARRTGPKEYAQKQGWVSASRPGKLRLWWAKLRS